MQEEHHIRQELQRVGRPYRDRIKNFATLCANPSCPSLDSSGKLKLEITKDGKKAHCWVCDWSGSWDSFARLAGLQPIKAHRPGCYSAEAMDSDFGAQLRKAVIDNNRELREFDLNKEGELPSGLSQWSVYTKEPYRGLSVEFLTSLDARYWVHKTAYHSTPRLLLPFYQYGKLVGYTGRRLDSDPLIKYYNAPWAQAKNILYPFDYVTKSNPTSVVLVEGQLDALSLINAGIPALCLMGTNNWSNMKRAMLLNTTITDVYICMDGDEAGRLAASKLYYGNEHHDSLQSYFSKVDVINLPDDTDPGSLDVAQLAWLRSYMGLS